MNKRIEEIIDQSMINNSHYVANKGFLLKEEGMLKIAELVIRDVLKLCEDQLSTLVVEEEWDAGWQGCLERMEEIVATHFDINHELFSQHNPEKPFFKIKG